MDSSTSSLVCPACGGENASDSRFCRHCGAALASATAAPAEAHAAEAVATPAAASAATAAVATPSAVHSVVPPVDLNGDNEELSSPSEIDGRRARQLLERALYLSERGDMGGAILATRQSIALAPTVAGGHAMLGLLLERSGDVAHAVGAYEKAVQLAPNSTAERESLQRLQEKLQAQQGAKLFHFDDDELFADTTQSATEENKKEKKEAAPAEAPAAAPVAEAAEASAVAVPAAAAVAASVAEASAEAEEAPLPNIGAAAPGLPAAFVPPVPAEVPTPDVSEFHGLDAKSGASHVGPEAKLPPSRPATAPEKPAADVVPLAAPVAPAPAIAERRGPDRRKVAVPVVTDRRNHFERRSVASTPRLNPVGIAPIFIPGTQTSREEASWSNMLARPSFYGRSLPLVGATIVALGFLTWARSWAVGREPAPAAITAPAPTDPAPAESNPAPVQPENISTNPANPASAPPPPLAPVGQNGGFVINTRPAAPAPAAAPGAGSTIAKVAMRPAPAVTGGSNVSEPRSAPAAATQPRTGPAFPKVIPPAAVPASGSSNSGNIGLPAPNISAPAPAPAPVNVLPPDSSNALNPAGSSNRGYVRITQGKIGSSSVPQRPAAQASADERTAANASPDRAIDRLSQAINSDSSDAGFRYQQRASLFLDRGDYSRAADDFQSAISAYNDQINRGEQVAAARAGLRAARSGLNVALAGKKN